VQFLNLAEETGMGCKTIMPISVFFLTNKLYMFFICANAQFLPASQPVLTADNSSFKWGDGLFETIKVFRGAILFEQFHFDRLFSGLKLLGILEGAACNPEMLRTMMLRLCEKNNCTALARVRLAVFRTEENTADYLIEARPLTAQVNQWENKGWNLDIFPFARKNMDAYANLKTANFLPYVLAGKYARENGFDDVLLLNAENRLCDSSRANLFLVKDGAFYTPALHQGCINGVIRRYLVEEGKKKGFIFHQQPIGEEDLLGADEVFLTNSILDIRWVRSFRQKLFGYEHTQAIYNGLFSTIYQ
jgi:branched-chain amino acid aminotransferase